LQVKHAFIVSRLVSHANNTAKSRQSAKHTEKQMLFYWAVLFSKRSQDVPLLHNYKSLQKRTLCPINHHNVLLAFNAYMHYSVKCLW